MNKLSIFVGMKRRVKYTLKSYFMPVISILILAWLAWSRHQRHGDMFFLWLFVGLLTFMLVLTLFLAPVSVSLTGNAIKLRAPLSRKNTPIDKIVKVKEFVPSATIKSTFGSRDWLGTWGWFKDNRIGRYRAFYGNPDECFLVELSDGKIFLIGCVDSKEMMNEIRKKCNLNQ